MLRQIHHRLTAVVVSLFMGVFMGNGVHAAPFAALDMDACSGHVINGPRYNAVGVLSVLRLSAVLQLFLTPKSILNGVQHATA